MELTNDFRVAIPVSQAWAVLTDLERIAPCMPGAQLQEVEGETFRGVVKVKVGPVSAQYKGEASFVERDEEAGVMVLRAEGRETRGSGNANATITARLTPDDDGTAVSLTTDLTITGRVAQFGRGVLADVSAKLLGQFVESLEETILADDRTADDADGEDGGFVSEDPPADDERATAVRKIDGPEATPVDLADAVGLPIGKVVAALAAVVIVAWVIRRLASRR